MPYTTQEAREPIIPHLEEAMKHIHTKGDLTFAITYLMHLRTKQICKEDEGYKIRYTKMSDVRSSTGDAYDEYYRVVMAPYEDQKRKENGPVSELDAIE